MESRNVKKAYKWSAMTELSSKIITPLINMILARILTPEDFGILATVMMVISFAEVFVESGFSKILIQRKFDTRQQEEQYISVAFWTNLGISFVIWGVVIVFREAIADFVGNGDLGTSIAVTGLMIPLYAIIGILNCKIKKDLEFHRLFYVRISSALVPLVVTVPLALMGLSYWALIIGNICGAILRFVLLMKLSVFKPILYFSFRDLKSMLKNSIWTLLDGVAVWLTTWIDSFLISRHMSDYYLGLYKNSTTTVMSLFGIITASITPVLFSSLSKVQTDQKAFEKVFYSVQKCLLIFLIPMSVGVFLYREFATLVLFGDAWGEAAYIVGITALTFAMRNAFVSIYSDVFRAKGKFYWPLIMQCADILILIIFCLPALQNGFWEFVNVRALVRLDLVIPSLVLANIVCGLSLKNTLKDALPPIVAVILMSIGAIMMQAISDNIIWSIMSIGICVAIYFAVLFLFPYERNVLLGLFNGKRNKSSEENEKHSRESSKH